eukprot:GEMP01026957.1.p1 GENE.GEMP01026957.1~~GEMP01026957.1.p1  ORF type:complete len:432 (+),score=74.97 GEMP01026957.1:452-1747(+)
MKFFWTGGFLLGCVSALRFHLRRGNEDGIMHRATEESQIVLKNFHDMQYFGEFDVGGQHLPAIFDTGSFDIMVLSTDCRECVVMDMLTDDYPELYNKSKSSHFHAGPLHIRARHEFGSGNISSTHAYDDVVFGGRQISNMSFWQVTHHEIRAWNYASFSSIVGLSKNDVVPEMAGHGYSLKEQTLLKRAGVEQFSICLRRGEKADGILDLDPQPSSNAVEVKVVGTEHWGVKLDMLSFGDGRSVCKEGCGAIIDSGTSLFAMSRGLLDSLKLDTLIDEDCANYDQLPNMEIMLGSHKFILPPAAYVTKMVGLGSTDDLDLLFNPSHGGTRKKVGCTSAFQEIDKQSIYGPVVIFGMPFLRYYATTFVREKLPHEAALRFQQVDANCEAMETPLPSTMFVANKATRERPNEIDPSKTHVRMAPWAYDKKFIF